MYVHFYDVGSECLATFANPVITVVRATKFCTVVPNICGSSVWYLLDIGRFEVSPGVLENCVPRCYVSVRNVKGQRTRKQKNKKKPHTHTQRTNYHETRSIGSF